VSEALAVSIELVRYEGPTLPNHDIHMIFFLFETPSAIRPIGAPLDAAMKPHLVAIFEATLGRLKAQDVDQEVKERAISCLGVILAHAGDQLAAETAAALPVVLDKACVIILCVLASN